MSLNCAKNLAICLLACLLFSRARGEEVKPVVSEEERKDGWTALFDGTTSSGWKKIGGTAFPDKGWVIEDGCLYRKTAGGGDIVTLESYENFELSLEWKVNPGTNSGVKYRVEDKPGSAFGPEMQILDDDKADDGKKPNHRAGAIYDLMAPNDKKKLKPVGEFNLSKLLVNGNHVEHWLNGEKIIEYDFFSDAWKAAVAASKFKNNPKYGLPAKGHIALQDHGGEVWYRNIKIKVLK